MKYLKVWTDLTNAIEPLKDAERGRLFTAMLNYAERGAEPKLVGNERFIWPTVKAEINRQREAYERQCAVNKANITSRYEALRTVTNGYEPKQEYKTKDKEKERNKKTIFTPPSADEVEAYCLERNNGIDANAFVNFYASKGWMIGKNRMKDWKAAIRTWERNRRPDQKEKFDARDFLKGDYIDI